MAITTTVSTNEFQNFINMREIFTEQLAVFHVDISHIACYISCRNINIGNDRDRLRDFQTSRERYICCKYCRQLYSITPLSQSANFFLSMLESKSSWLRDAPVIVRRFTAFHQRKARTGRGPVRANGGGTTIGVYVNTALVLQRKEDEGFLLYSRPLSYVTSLNERELYA